MLLLFALFVGSLARIDNTNDANIAIKISNRVPDESGHGAFHNAICSGCTDLVTEVKAFLSNPEDVEKLKTTLKDDFCSYLGGAKQDCINLVNEDLTSLIHQLQPLIDNPEKMCEDLKMCTTGPMELMFAKKFMVQAGKRYMTHLRAGSSAILCDECEFLIGEVKDIFDNNGTQGEIKDIILQTCGYLGDLEGECRSLVNDNWDRIVGIVDKELSDRKRVCEQLGLCASQNSIAMRFARYHQQFKIAIAEEFHPSKIPKTAALIRTLENRLGSKAGCLTCEFFMKWLEGFLKNDYALRDITKEVQRICPLLPNDVDRQCDDFLGIYGPPVLNMTVLTYLQPEAVCEVLTACAKPELELFRRSNRMTCEACEATFALVKMELRKRELQTELDGALKKLICNKINPEYKSECGELIDGYLPQIWTIVDDAIDSQAICKDIGACT